MKYAPMLGAFLFAVVGCGCVNREATRVAENPPPAASPTSAAAAPSAREFDEGYHDLLDHLVVTVQPEQLLGAAWKAVVAEAANEHVKSQIRAPSLSADANADLANFDQAYTELVDAGDSKLDLGKLQDAGLTAMAEAVNDCHTAYLPRDQWESVDADLSGQEMLPSLPLSFQLGRPYLVTWVAPDSGGTYAGVKAGDQIVEFDGRSLDSIPLSQRKFLISGAAGTSVDLLLQAPNGLRRSVTVQRELIQRPVIDWHLVGDVAYIHLRTFTLTLNLQIDAVFNQARSQGARGYVLDLRGNLGGELGSDVHLLSHFIESGELAVTADRAGHSQQINPDGSFLPGPPPLAVLVDSGSLSASELFAEDIKEFHAGELVGTPTPGCLLGSSFRDLADGSAMQVSELKVSVGPRQVIVNHAGVQPDVTVPISAADLAAGRDPQLDRAVADVNARLQH